MTIIPFQSAKLAPQQWTRLGMLVRGYRLDHAPLTQDEFADHLTHAVQVAVRDGITSGSIKSQPRYTKQDISRIEAWARPEGKRPRRLPRITHTYQLEGLATLLGMRVEDMLGELHGGRMTTVKRDAARGPLALGEALQRHESTADEAVVWSKHPITMFFPTAALYAFYRANYDNPEAAENWVNAAEERRDAVLGRAATRRWNFTHVLFASDLCDVVTGSGRFASIDPDLRAACLGGLLHAITNTANCNLAVVDDNTEDPEPALQELKLDVGAYTHISNMGDGCVVLHDLLDVWYVGEYRRDVRTFRHVLSDLVEAARYREKRDLQRYLESLIQQTLDHPV